MPKIIQSLFDSEFNRIVRFGIHVFPFQEFGYSRKANVFKLSNLLGYIFDSKFFKSAGLEHRGRGKGSIKRIAITS